MATNTKNFNFKKPDESDFYSFQDQNGNWDLADEELQKLNEPAFEDYTTGTSVPPAATALEALKSKVKLPVWMSNVVAFCKGCCTLAMIVNNCVSSDADKPLAAAQGKVLQDQLTKLYSDFGGLLRPNTETVNIDSTDLASGTYVIGTGMSGTKPFEYGILIQFKRYTYTIQIAIDIDSAAIAKRQTNNERWPNWDFYVTKSDLTENTIIIDQRAISGNDSNIGTFTLSKEPSNKYAIVGCITGGTTDSKTAISQIFVTGNQARVYFTNTIPSNTTISVAFFYR